MWKYFYGFRKSTTLEFTKFMKSSIYQKAWFSLITYYLTTERSKLRKDEDPEIASKEFLKRCSKHDWVIDNSLRSLLKKNSFLNS